MKTFRPVYRGPWAWFVWLNLTASFVAFAVSASLWLIMHRDIGWLMPTIMIGFVVFLRCVALLPSLLLLFACILVVVPKVRWNIKLPTIAFALGACLLLFWILRIAIAAGFATHG